MAKQFKEKFKEFRLLLGLTLTEMANLLDVSFSTVYRYEVGLRKPKMKVIQKILSLAKLKEIDLDPMFFS